MKKKTDVVVYRCVGFCGVSTISFVEPRHLRRDLQLDLIKMVPQSGRHCPPTSSEGERLGLEI